MPEAVRILPHYAYDEYVSWEGKWELIEGIPFSIKLEPQHQLLLTNITAEFCNGLKPFKKLQAYPSIDYLIKVDTVVRPDLLIVNREIQKNFLDFSPALVVEILSPSTALKDRHTKYALYQEQGINYYIIIDCASNEAEIYSLVNKSYQLVQKGKDFRFEFKIEDCVASVNFGEIW